ncbi:uroporphyrinogen-III synthase [Brachybacterium massiliense]|uniref:uroporphyrinogen-III synthase n=1 Tax=Brachybacterium massiliense TaxID=1755098 RepID=UPI000B3BB8C8|nr:uroporphyrinogen-III synthase [Brachybacterium massiliense]
MSAPARLSAALEGRRLVLALDRRAEELAAALTRHGAEILHAPAMSMIPHVDDPLLLARTAELIARPPQLLIATTGVGMRGWFEAADAVGSGDALRAALADTRVIARGPKARGAAQQVGLTVDWVAEEGTSAEVIAHLTHLTRENDRKTGHDLRGVRAAVQHHGSGADGIDEALQAAGAEVTTLTVYRWGPPRDLGAVHRSVLEAAAGGVDAVLFTAAPGTENWLAAAERAGALPGIAARVREGRLLMAAVGPLTAAPLEARGLPALRPARSRMGALARAVITHFDPAQEAAP